jgi:signal transduction histidine kinase
MTSDQHPFENMTNLLATLKTISALVMEAANAGSLEQVLEQIASVSQQMIGARYAALGVPDAHGDMKYFKYVGIRPERAAKMGALPRGHGLLGAIMRARQPVCLDHIAEDSRSVGFPKHHPKMDSLLGVPIRVGQQLFGSLYLCDRVDGRPFTDQDQWLVEVLAGYAALAIAGAQIGDQQGRLLLLEERERVSMELHDGTIQSLYAIGMQLQLMHLSRTFSEEALTTAIHNLDSAIEDVRRYILDLKLINYQPRSMADTLHDLVARLHLPATLSLTLDAPERVFPFPAPVIEAVCQIAQETISNVVRHAHATQITLRAAYDNQRFILTIHDNGQGFDIDRQAMGEGMGLRHMHQRARIYGGHVQIHSEAGAGTTVMLELPIKG